MMSQNQFRAVKCFLEKIASMGNVIEVPQNMGCVFRVPSVRKSWKPLVLGVLHSTEMNMQSPDQVLAPSEAVWRAPGESSDPRRSLMSDEWVSMNWAHTLLIKILEYDPIWSVTPGHSSLISDGWSMIQRKSSPWSTWPIQICRLGLKLVEKRGM
jgi:hypothetical protein